MNRFLACLTAQLSALVILSAAVASAAEWGNLKGRFVVDGTPPERTPLNPGNDAFCIGQKPVDETVLIGEKGALANLVVYISLPRGEKIDVHPDYAELATKPVVLDNKNCRFNPRIVLLRKDQQLVVKNSDPMGHNTHVADDFNSMIPANDQVAKAIARTMTVPIPIQCDIHTFMKGAMLVLDHPYMALTNEKGEFEIKNIPAGTRNFTFWHEAPGYLRDAKLGSVTTDRRGKADLAIKPGETLDLGEVHLPVSAVRTSR